MINPESDKTNLAAGSSPSSPLPITSLQCLHPPHMAASVQGYNITWPASVQGHNIIFTDTKSFLFIILIFHLSIYFVLISAMFHPRCSWRRPPWRGRAAGAAPDGRDDWDTKKGRNLMWWCTKSIITQALQWLCSAVSYLLPTPKMWVKTKHLVQHQNNATNN